MKIMENAFDYPDAPVILVSGINGPMHKSPVFNILAIPDKERIKKQSKESLQ